MYFVKGINDFLRKVNVVKGKSKKCMQKRGEFLIEKSASFFVLNYLI